ARTVIVPLGLDAVVHALDGGRIYKSPLALELAKEILQQLRAALEQDSASYSLDAILDDRPIGRRHNFTFAISPADASVNPREGLKSAGVLHTAADGGTAAYYLPLGKRPARELLVEHLRHAWRETRVRRLQFVSSEAKVHQATAAWAK